MIKLGDIVRLKDGFQHTEGICKQVELLKWSEESALVRGHKYLVLGGIFDDKNNKISHTFLTQGTLTYCRKFIGQLLQDENILINNRLRKTEEVH